MSASISRPIIAGEGEFQVLICFYADNVNHGPFIEKAVNKYAYLLRDRQYVDAYSMSDFIGLISEVSDPTNQEDREIISRLSRCF